MQSTESPRQFSLLRLSSGHWRGAAEVLRPCWAPRDSYDALMDLELKDRAFLITGGTDGLGLALALSLIREGALVAVCGRDTERLAVAREQLGATAVR